MASCHQSSNSNKFDPLRLVLYFCLSGPGVSLWKRGTPKAVLFFHFFYPYPFCSFFAHVDLDIRPSFDV